MKALRNFILLFIVLNSSIGQIQAQDYWEKLITPVNPQHILFDVIVDNEGSIYLSYQDSGIYRSDDNAITWTKRNFGLGYYAGLISCMADDKNGNIYAGCSGGIFKSSDKGNNWSKTFDANYYATDFTTIRCGYDSIVLAGGIGIHGIVRSADNGSTWSHVLDLSHTNYQETTTDIQFGPDGVIYACSRITMSNEPGRIFASYDLGRTWQVISYIQYPMALGFDAQGRLLMGQFGYGLKRYDYSTGQWTTLLANGSSPQEILTFPDNRIFLGCYWWPSSLLGGVQFTSDGGSTFSFLNTGFNDCTNASEFAIDITGRILVVNIYLFRSYNIVFDFQKEEKRIDNSLYIYPNPFGHSFTYKAQLAGFNSINTLKVYSIHGQQVFSKTCSGNTNTTMISDLPPGIYYVSLTNGKFTATCKVVHY